MYYSFVQDIGNLLICLTLASLILCFTPKYIAKVSQKLFSKAPKYVNLTNQCYSKAPKYVNLTNQCYSRRQPVSERGCEAG